MQDEDPQHPPQPARETLGPIGRLSYVFLLLLLLILLASPIPLAPFSFIFFFPVALVFSTELSFFETIVAILWLLSLAAITIYPLVYVITVIVSLISIFFSWVRFAGWCMIACSLYLFLSFLTPVLFFLYVMLNQKS